MEYFTCCKKAHLSLRFKKYVYETASELVYLVDYFQKSIQNVAKMCLLLLKGIQYQMLQKSISNWLRNSMYIKDCRLTSLQNNQLTNVFHSIFPTSEVWQPNLNQSTLLSNTYVQKLFRMKSFSFFLTFQICSEIFLFQSCHHFCPYPWKLELHR